MVFIQAVLPKKANTIKFYGKMFTSEMGIEHAKLEFH